MNDVRKSFYDFIISKILLFEFKFDVINAKRIIYFQQRFKNYEKKIAKNKEKSNQNQNNIE